MNTQAAKDISFVGGDMCSLLTEKAYKYASIVTSPVAVGDSAPEMGKMDTDPRAAKATSGDD